jgi:4-hydroxybenzoate polyprenyltransferase
VLDRVRGYLVLPHAVPIIVVLAATAAFALVAAEGWPGTGTMVLLLGAMLGGQLAIGATNELVDVELDAVARPDKPIPSGLVSLRGARTMAGFGTAMMVALVLPLGWDALSLCALGTGAGVAYSLWFKRTVWSWVPYLVALPLLPIWVWAVIDRVPPGLFAIYPIGAAAIVAVQIAQSLPDVATDRDNGVRTLAVVLGERRALWACRGAVGVAAVVAVALAPWLTGRPLPVVVGAGLAITLVAANAVHARYDHPAAIRSCFPVVAPAVVALGIGWAVALVSG